MATTRKKLGEQILRIVNGGNISDDSHIDIREVMALVDQERDSIIKREIMTNAYSKGTAMSIAEAEIRGDWLTQETLYMSNDSSHVVLNNMPINLPNDLGIYRVESIFGKLDSSSRVNKGKMTITLTTGVTDASTNTVTAGVIDISSSPTILDKKYLISLTLNDGAKDHKISFNVYTNNEARTAGRNLLYAIYNSDGWNSFVKKHNISSNIDDSGNLDFQLLDTTNASWSFSDFKINGQDSADTGHGFTYTLTQPTFIVTSNPQEDTSLIVTLRGKSYSVDYKYQSGTSETNVVAQNFVTKNAYKMAMEVDVSVTVSGSIITIEEIVPKGGFHPDLAMSGSGNTGIKVTTPGEIVATVEYTNLLGQEIATFNERAIYTRMPSNGPHHPLYNETAIMSGRKFFYLEGNKVYLYKNYEKIDYLDIHYIATSSSVSDTDTYPVPADYEKEIIMNLVQLFSVMSKAKEDLVNDNIG